MAYNNIEIQFTENTLELALASALPTLGCGGECVFVGRTRPETNITHGELIALQYHCYKEMAEIELQTLAQEAMHRFGARVIRITHSTGRVAPNEASVVIAVGCDHRDAAFTACRFMIDALKQRVPIWKEELWADGTTWSDGEALRTL